jgi:DNA adenine methylase
MVAAASQVESRPKRPVLRYHGGKFRIANWIVSHFPNHKIYVEPFGGAGSVLMAKQRSYAEIYNDLDSQVVNVFRVLRDSDQAIELERLIRLTPFARDEFEHSYEPCEDPIERARRTILRSFMAHGTTSRRQNHTGFRAKNYVSRTNEPASWADYPAAIASFTARLSGVTLENQDATHVIRRHDSPDSLFYVDPTYLASTRPSFRSFARSRAYFSELTTDDHVRLAQLLNSLKGRVVLSGYPSPLYDELYRGWARHEKEACGDHGSRRLEVLWLNPACSGAAPKVTENSPASIPPAELAPLSSTQLSLCFERHELT